MKASIEEKKDSKKEAHKVPTTGFIVLQKPYIPNKRALRYTRKANTYVTIAIKSKEVINHLQFLSSFFITKAVGTQGMKIISTTRKERAEA